MNIFKKLIPLCFFSILPCDNENETNRNGHKKAFPCHAFATLRIADIMNFIHIFMVVLLVAVSQPNFEITCEKRLNKKRQVEVTEKSLHDKKYSQHQIWLQ